MLSVFLFACFSQFDERTQKFNNAMLVFNDKRPGHIIQAEAFHRNPDDTRRHEAQTFTQ
jgi:hypothetical protein